MTACEGPLRYEIQKVPSSACLAVCTARAVAAKGLLIHHSARGFSIDIKISCELRKQKDRFFKKCFVTTDDSTREAIRMLFDKSFGLFYRLKCSQIRRASCIEILTGQLGVALTDVEIEYTDYLQHEFK